MTPQIAWFIAMVTAVCTALLGQAELLGEPWRHYVTVAAVIGTALTAFMLQHPPKQWDGKERRGKE